MESEHFITCIKRSSRAFEDLAGAQNDCKAKVDAEIDNLTTLCERRITPAEKSNIKKLVKAIASDKADSFKKEARSLAIIVADFFQESIQTEINWNTGGDE